MPESPVGLHSFNHDYREARLIQSTFNFIRRDDSCFPACRYWHVFSRFLSCNRSYTSLISSHPFARGDPLSEPNLASHLIKTTLYQVKVLVHSQGANHETLFFSHRSLAKCLPNLILLIWSIIVHHNKRLITSAILCFILFSCPKRQYSLHKYTSSSHP